ncbi:hypothetical protein BDE36_0411 [Arcticibacter tournemirensis]|uniref:Uncharacterized protein n=1 Tax=Arcticibacter tournemirensis TaxID=699437 RepID=A0A5M9HJF2_9SPHI|nr:hypothetical protein [Arcticibacter tournemirensis]KAA8485564.1 hypothetical protein F1649_03525 [Arcticibacter tournemirensis]TQM48721.1 hypothetical protein BDE36_0411 [Arcticibacter tournemirensis]
MPNKYFKPHESFDLNSHKYDVGILTGLKDGYEDNLFIKKVLELPELEYESYYLYHLDYFLSKEPQGEQEFFSFVWQIVLRRINYLEIKDPFNSSHALDVEIIEKLLHFQKYLRSIDQWDTQRTLPEIIADQQETIRKQQEEIAALKDEVKAAKKLETQEFINIADGYLLTFLDICLQIQDDTLLPDGKKELVLSQTQIVWCKMIAKYFREGGNEISLETIRRYFPADRKNPGSKYAKIPPQLKLFQLKPAKKRS